MSKRKEHYETMLFHDQTTSRTIDCVFNSMAATDFQEDGEIEPIVYKEKPPCLGVRPPPLKDTHALTDWKVPNVPFNLMHKPKEIVQTNPRRLQEPYFGTVDELQKEVLKTRPRLVMTPAGSLDDAGEREREMLVKDIYMTTLKKMARDAKISAPTYVRAPLSPVLAPANPITLEKLHPCYVAPEWRMDSVSWDNRQLRAYCNPTKDFWLARTPKCEICRETSDRKASEKLKRLTQQR